LTPKNMSDIPVMEVVIKKQHICVNTVKIKKFKTKAIVVLYCGNFYYSRFKNNIHSVLTCIFVRYTFF